MASIKQRWEGWMEVFGRRSDELPYVHLERSSRDGVCLCECPRALVGMPGQMDCPWCGCGWLFNCAACGRSFTYAKPVWISMPLGQIVEQDMLARGWKHDPSAFAAAAEGMAEMLSKVEGNGEYVYLDGLFLPLQTRNTEVQGTSANHKITVLPHLLERRMPGTLESVLGDGKYWWDNKRQDVE